MITLEVGKNTCLMKLNLKRKILRRFNLTFHPRYKSIPRGKGTSFFRRPKSSFLRLIEKQRLRYHHALSHRQLKRYTSTIRRSPGPAGLSLLCDLAMRLDSILFQVGFADSILAARQLISHGHVFVNGYCVSVPGYRCDTDDLVCMAPTLKVRRLVNHYLLKNRRLFSSSSADRPLETNMLTSGYATTCVRNQKVLIHRDIKPRELTFRVNHMLVMEYFS